MKYLKSAVLVPDYPPPNRPEVAVAGRSNAGKSSFLNAIAGSKVAHVSQEPGKTRLLNFFEFGSHYRFVDMPGYGFAARSGDEMQSWSQMVETYLTLRGNLKGLVLLMDLRREWTADEEMLKKYCQQSGKAFCVALTKADKCSTKEQRERLKVIQKTSQVAETFLISSQTKTGIKELEDFIFNEWIKNKETR